MSEIIWIDARKWLPGSRSGEPFFKSCRVLVVGADRYVKIAQLWYTGGEFCDRKWVDMDHFVVPGVTHWADLPFPPSNPNARGIRIGRVGCEHI